MSQRSVLVVDADASDRSNTVTLLEAAGYRVTSASAFEEAKHVLATQTPDLLITELRLGPYNGLHLILRSRIEHPAMAAIVTSRVLDPVLQAEAERQHAEYVLRPIADRVFLDTINRSLNVPPRAMAGAESTPRHQHP